MQLASHSHHRIEIPVTGTLNTDLAASVVARVGFVRPDFEVLLNFVRAERLDDVILGTLLSTCAQGHPHTLAVTGLPDRYQPLLSQLGIRCEPAVNGPNGHHT